MPAFIFKEKTNRLTVVVKGKDSEKTNSTTKYIVYPKGKDENKR